MVLGEKRVRSISFITLMTENGKGKGVGKGSRTVKKLIREKF